MHVHSPVPLKNECGVWKTNRADAAAEATAIWVGTRNREAAGARGGQVAWRQKVRPCTCAPPMGCTVRVRLAGWGGALAPCLTGPTPWSAPPPPAPCTAPASAASSHLAVSSSRGVLAAPSRGLRGDPGAGRGTARARRMRAAAWLASSKERRGTSGCRPVPGPPLGVGNGVVVQSSPAGATRQGPPPPRGVTGAPSRGTAKTMCVSWNSSPGEGGGQE
jgi:hypothetical protein